MGGPGCAAWEKAQRAGTPGLQVAKGCTSLLPSDPCGLCVCVWFGLVVVLCLFVLPAKAADLSKIAPQILSCVKKLKLLASHSILTWCQKLFSNARNVRESKIKQTTCPQ